MPNEAQGPIRQVEQAFSKNQRNDFARRRNIKPLVNNPSRVNDEETSGTALMENEICPPVLVKDPSGPKNVVCLSPPVSIA
jgi:hypothetical protein